MVLTTERSLKREAAALLKETRAARPIRKPKTLTAEQDLAALLFAVGKFPGPHNRNTPKA